MSNAYDTLHALTEGHDILIELRVRASQAANLVDSAVLDASLKQAWIDTLVKATKESISNDRPPMATTR